MALDNYTNLKTAIGNWMARSDLTAEYDDFIDLAESLFRRPPEPLTSKTLGGIRANKSSDTGNLSGVTLALPSDYMELHSFDFTSDFRSPEFVSVDELKARKRTGTGQPCYFTINGANIEFDVTPDSTYAYAVEYWADFPALSGSVDDNWVLLNYPDCYLAGCLHYASLFVMDDARASFWANKYKGAAHGANEGYRRGQYTRGPINTVVGHRTP